MKRTLTGIAAIALGICSPTSQGNSGTPPLILECKHTGESYTIRNGAELERTKLFPGTTIIQFRESNVAITYELGAEDKVSYYTYRETSQFYGLRWSSALNNAPPVVSSDIVINRFNGYFWLKEILDMALIDAGRHTFGNEQQTGTCRRITVVPNAAPKF